VGRSPRPRAQTNTVNAALRALLRVITYPLCSIRIGPLLAGVLIFKRVFFLDPPDRILVVAMPPDASSFRPPLRGNFIRFHCNPSFFFPPPLFPARRSPRALMSLPHPFPTRAYNQLSLLPPPRPWFCVCKTTKLQCLPHLSGGGSFLLAPFQATNRCPRQDHLRPTTFYTFCPHIHPHPSGLAAHLPLTSRFYGISHANLQPDCNFVHPWLIRNVRSVLPPLVTFRAAEFSPTPCRKALCFGHRALSRNRSKAISRSSPSRRYEPGGPPHHPFLFGILSPSVAGRQVLSPLTISSLRNASIAKRLPWLAL